MKRSPITVDPLVGSASDAAHHVVDDLGTQQRRPLLIGHLDAGRRGHQRVGPGARQAIEDRRRDQPGWIQPCGKVRGSYPKRWIELRQQMQVELINHPLSHAARLNQQQLALQALLTGQKSSQHLGNVRRHLCLALIEHDQRFGFVGGRHPADIGRGQAKHDQHEAEQEELATPQRAPQSEPIEIVAATVAGHAPPGRLIADARCAMDIYGHRSSYPAPEPRHGSAPSSAERAPERAAPSTPRLYIGSHSRAAAAVPVTASGRQPANRLRDTSV